jgi:hypothetical protein
MKNCEKTVRNKLKISKEQFLKEIWNSPKIRNVYLLLMKFQVVSVCQLHFHALKRAVKIESRNKEY